MDDTLRLIFWELTARCNLKCQHCRAEAQDSFDPGELTTDEIISVAKDIRRDADPIVVLTGGEPLVRDDFFDIAESCTKLFTRVAVATNGTLLNDKLAAGLVQCGVQRTSISLDGAVADTHDRFRGLPGSFDRALAGCDSLRRAGMSLQVNATVTRHNDSEIEDLLNLAIECGADAFHVFMLVPVGCGAQISDEVRLSPQRTEEILTWLFEKSLQLSDRLHIKATCAPQYYRIMRQICRQRGIAVPSGHGMHAVTRGCLAGSAVCFISRTGDVQGCGYLPIRVGNVRDQSLSDICRQSDVFAALSDPNQLKGKCSQCEYRKVCGGCRARAYAITRDCLAADPDCRYQPPKPDVGCCT